MEGSSSEKRSKKRRWWFRVVAVALSLVPLVLFEGVLVLGGWGTPDPKEDPFAGFAEVVPLFQLNEAGDAYEILSQSRKDWFYPQTFPATKAEDTYRIFVLGGSTVAGRPYTVETAFSTWLKLFLEYAEPTRHWEVVNCGGVSYASYRLVPILEEVLENYAPDLIVLYTGHNEFLEDRTYAHVKQLPAAVTKPYALASKLRIFNVMRSEYWKLTGKVTPESIMETRAILPDEVDALLEHEGGMEHYYRDEAWHAGVIDHYRFNLDRMCAATKKAGMPMILMNPAENLRDQPPFKSEHRAGLTEDERQLFDQYLAEGRPDEALKIDDLHADAHFQLAKKLEREGELNGYDLDLMSVSTLADLADTGDSLVLAALVSGDLHIRIFDNNGRIVIDKLEEDLLSGQDLTDLKELLGTPLLPDQSQLPQAMRQELINKAASISGHTQLNVKGAHAAYVRSKDEDVCPLRMLESMHAIVKEVAARHGVQLLDTRKETEAVAMGGIPGNSEFLDHVHPTIGGHQYFAKLLFEKMDAMEEVVIPSEEWMVEVGPMLQAHAQALGSAYFREGDIRLENLRQWALGRSTLEPPVKSKREKPSSNP